jgi:hypothetical protein
MDKLTINSNFKFDVMKDFLVPNKYDFYIVFSRDYSRNKRGDVKPRDTLNSIFKKSTPEIKLMYIKKIEDTEIFGAVRKNKSPKPTNNYTSTTDFPSDYYYVARDNINTETVELTHIYFRTSIQASESQEFNIVTLIYCVHSTDDLSEDYTDGTDQPNSNPFTAEGVNARILAQIKPEIQFMTRTDPGNVAPDSISKLQLMIEL